MDKKAEGGASSHVPVGCGHEKTSVVREERHGELFCDECRGDLLYRGSRDEVV